MLQLKVAEKFLSMTRFTYNIYLKFNVIINHYCRYIDNGASYCDVFNAEVVNYSVYYYSIWHVFMIIRKYLSCFLQIQN